MSAPTAPPGLELGAVERWLAERTGGLAGPLRAEVIAGGRSNLTYLLDDGTTPYVLRRPPLANVLPTAHDMAREHRVISALAGTGVPVPRTLGLCEDASVTGAPFYVMEYVDGEVVRERLPAAYPDTTETRRTMSLTLVDVLAALHAVDPASVGLGDLGHPPGYLARQVLRWSKQWELSRTRELPAIDELRERLTASLPEQSPSGIVHGDYRLDNVMFARDDPGRIVAVLDWEMCTAGDPLADVGLLLVYWGDRAHPMPTAAVASTRLSMSPGFLDGDELVREYARRSSRDLSMLEWYVALGAYKLAIVAEGIHARFLAGMTVGDGFETMGATVPVLVDAALERAARSGIPGLAGR